MVSSLSMAFMAISFAVIFLFPIILAAVMYWRYRFSWLALLLGILGQMPWYQQMAQNFFLVGLFLSFTAGLFEEVGRWLAFRFALKTRWQTKNGVAYGIGHGGFEAIFLVGLAYVNNLVISSMINNGQFEALIAPQMGAAAESVRSALVDTPSYMFLLGGIERVLTMIFHIALSLVVLNAVRLRKPVYLLYAILAHTVVNLGAVLIARLPNGAWLSEGFLLIVAAGCVLYIRGELRKPEPAGVEPAGEEAVE